MKNPEFSGIRVKLYKECLKQFPEAREADIEVMKKYLAPKSGETILEVGAGNGFFSRHILSLVGEKGKVIVSDPSSEQLEDVKEIDRNIEVIQSGAESLSLANKSIDAIWSLGAMHHVFEKQKSFENFYNALKKGGRLVIADVFSGSKLAKHFDDRVAKYCITGHEVAFWSDEYAMSLCFLTGFKKPEIIELNLKWKFNSKEDIGIFLYKIHAMTKTTPKECLKGAEEILGIEKIKECYFLNWPLKLIKTIK